jgi:acyl-coenzyme A synthetase/AMP-(fatty) acid ligase
VTTLVGVLERGVQRHGGVPVHFIGADGGEVTRTLAELWADARRLAGFLADEGAAAGDVVAFQPLSWWEAAVTSYAAAILEATAVPLVYVYGPREVEWVLNDVGARWFVVAPHADPDLATGRAELASRCPTVQAVIAISRSDLGLEWAVVAKGTGEVRATTPLPGRRLVLYTSGTEAAPKGVQHTESSILGEVLSSRPCGHSVAPDEMVMFTGPVGHIGSMYLVYPFAHGLPVVFLDRWRAEVAGEAIARHGVTFTHGPPIVVLTLADLMARDPSCFSTLRRVRLGGAEIPPDLVRRLDEEFGIVGFHTYGSTEHPTTTSGTEEDPLDKRVATDGRPLPGNEVRILDADGAEVPTGTEGQIWTRGPELFAGYVDADLDRAARVDGWYRTGDLGYLDGDGYLTVSGRIKDVVVRGGENIPTRRVADVLLRHPDVVDAVVVPAKDPLYGERAFAFVVTADRRDLDLDEMARHFAAEQVSRHFVPEGIERLDELPRNATGKVRRDVLRTRADELWARRHGPIGRGDGSAPTNQ